jgi:hypothetical protein
MPALYIRVSDSELAECKRWAAAERRSLASWARSRLLGQAPIADGPWKPVAPAGALENLSRELTVELDDEEVPFK